MKITDATSLPTLAAFDGDEHLMVVDRPATRPRLALAPRSLFLQPVVETLNDNTTATWRHGTVVLVDADGEGAGITLPADTYQPGQGFTVIQLNGTDEVLFAAGDGVTIVTRALGNYGAGVNARIEVTCIADNTFLLTGDLSSGGY